MKSESGGFNRKILGKVRSQKIESEKWVGVLGKLLEFMVENS
jgi:hypothetical protein